MPSKRTFNIECVFQMPRPKGWKRSLAARERRADQLAIGCRPYLSPPPPPDPKVVGTGWRHSAKKQNWPVSEHTDKCHKLVIPPECPGKKFVFVIGHSHLRAIVDRFVAMPEGCLSFGFSSTPGGSASDLHRELEQIALPREPDLALLLAPCNDLHASPTITDAGTAYGDLLQYLLGRFQRVLVLDFPTRIREDLEIQNLLRQEFRRVSAVWKTRYFLVAEHFPVHRRELWSKDGTHLSDDHGMGILAQLMWQACYMELETPVPAPKVSHPPTCPSTRRVKPMLVVTGPLPRTPPPPSEWTPAEQGRKKNQQRTPKSSPGGPKASLVQPEVSGDSFLHPPLAQDFSPAMLVEMDKISPSHLDSFPKGKKAPQTRRQRAVARKNQPRDAVEATAVVVRPAVSPASPTPGPEEHKPVEVRPRRSLTRSSPGLEVRPCSPASTPPAQEEDQAVVEVRSRSPQRPSYADVVKGLSPVPSTSGMAVKRHSPASSSTSGMEEEVSRETIKPAAPKRRRFRRQPGAARALEVRPGSPASSSSEMEVDQVQAGVVEVIPGTSPTSVTILDVFLEQDQLDQMPETSQPRIFPAAPNAPDEDDKDKLHDSSAPSHTCNTNTVGSLDEEMEVGCSVVPSTSQFIQVPENIRGNFHQAEDLFEFRGVQCMAIALVALAKHTVSSVFSWTPEQLDWVVLLGDQLYTRLREAGKVNEDNEMLMVGHLPKNDTIDGDEFHFRFGNGAGGDAAVVQSEMIDLGVEFSLHCALEEILADYSLCIFTLCGYTCAIIVENGCFAVVDSHSRSSTGMPVEGGKSVVVFGRLGELEDYLSCLAACFDRLEKPFEIQGVVVTRTRVVEHLRSQEEHLESISNIPSNKEFESPKPVSVSDLEETQSPNLEGISCHKDSAMGKLWICATCNMKLRKGQMPAECHLNSLELDPIPPELESLNSLEHHLCCPTISFVRAMALPKGGQNGAHGPVTCVPANVLETTTLLPRTDMEGVVIPIKLKRKLSYKGYYEFQFVDPMRIRSALCFLKQNNKHFADIDFNEEWVNVFCPDPNECPQDDRVKTEPDEQMEDELLHDNQRHCIIPDTCLMPVDPGQEIMDQCFDNILNLAPAEGNNPLKLRSDEDHEAKCFPKLFPFARNTFHAHRRIPLTLFRYFLNRIMHVDRRFAHNAEYIFFALSMIEVDQVVSKVSIASRKGHSGSKTSSGKNVKDSLKEMLNHDDGYHFLHPIRGTPAYWQTAQKDLLACVRQLGLPTWFCSFSSADLRWPELLEALLKTEGRQQKVESLTWEDRCDLLRRNSVVAAQMFDHRWHVFLNDVILSIAEPIGRVVDYFYRVEFQQRGSPHVHCLFWVEGAPLVGVNTDEEVTAFVDKYVTCETPTDDDDLFELVTSVQTHSKRHSKTCRKGSTVCRFNFPRPPSMRTFIKKKEPKLKCNKCDLKEENADCTCNPLSTMTRERAKAIMTAIKEVAKDENNPYGFVAQLFEALGLTQATMEEALIKLGGNTQIILKRELKELYNNNYNKPCVRTWRANMDIQLVIDAWACIVYIVTYISKAERQMGLLLHNAALEAKKGNLDAQQSMKKMGTVYLHNREVSAQEAVYRLTNMHLKECSRKTVFAPAGENVVRLSRPLGELSESTSADEVWMTNLVDRYKNRPNNATFNDICLCTFGSEYRIVPSTETCKNAIPLQNGFGSVVKRTRSKPAVMRYPRFSETKNPNLFHQSLLQLFLPYRKDDDLKPRFYESFQQFYANGSIQFSDGTLHSVKSIVDANRNRFEALPEDFEDLQDIMASDDLLADAWGQLCPEQEVQRLESEQEVLENQQREDPSEQDPVPTIPDLAAGTQDTCRLEKSNNLPRSEGLALIRSLNEHQLSIFFKIRQWCLDKVAGKEPEPLHVFITGGAGTGKSHLIRAIHYEATRLLAPTCSEPDKISVLMTAPTGIAAYNLNAATIHSTFNIGINVTLPYSPLGDDKLNSLRAKYSDLLIVIIDEISMVHHKLMAYIHGRLRQIKQTGDFSPFGNICIIAVGDFYQLSPVYGKALYTPVDIGDFWNGLFEVAELRTIMRQKDVPFAQLLNRLRLRSKGTLMRKKDLDALRQRETGEECCDLHIFAKKDDVYAHNLERLKQLDPDYEIMYAQDFSLRKKVASSKNLMGTLVMQLTPT
ncbi:hypothetical protein WMY93_026141 [Mugilogobius chulae]|uniref:ATP-dependent DNA helicase n=1 Tax=Mugilogobius chulae TaxID=88201 RepID=A0AAW0N8G9_9GOBI